MLASPKDSPLLSPERPQHVLYTRTANKAHFALDLLLEHVSGGMLLFFPISWQEYQLGVIHSHDYRVALVLLCLAALVYVLRNRTRPGR
jgi:hypothetical protein